MNILNIKKATPMFSGIITTCDRYSEAESKHGSIIDTGKLNQIKDIQTIISLSEQAKARGLNEGDVLSVSFERYKKSTQKKDSMKGLMEEYKHSFYYELPIILLDKKECLLMDISDITLRIDDYEYITEGEGFITGEKELNFDVNAPKLIV